MLTHLRAILVLCPLGSRGYSRLMSPLPPTLPSLQIAPAGEVRVLADPPLHAVLPLWSFPLCSALASAAASVATHPIDVVKTRLQVLSNRGPSPHGGGVGGSQQPQRQLTAWQVRCLGGLCSCSHARFLLLYLATLHLRSTDYGAAAAAGVPAAVCGGRGAGFRAWHGRPHCHDERRQRRHLAHLRVSEALAGGQGAGGAAAPGWG